MVWREREEDYCVGDGGEWERRGVEVIEKEREMFRRCVCYMHGIMKGVRKDYHVYMGYTLGI
jgi:hypothetical protein